MIKRALVMSGGGAKGSFEVGAVDYLVNKANMDFDVIAGVSAGALTAAVLAQGKGLPGLQKQATLLLQQWLAIKGPRDNFRTRFLGKLLPFICTTSIYDPAAVREKLQRLVRDAELQASGKKFRIGVVSLESGEYVSVNQAKTSAAMWTLASGSIPLAFPPIAAEGESFVDGGVRNITPFQDAFRALKDFSKTDELELYFVLASPVGPMASMAGTKWRPGLKIALRAVDILTDQIYKEDVRYALDVNDSVRAHAALAAKLGRAHPLQAAVSDLPFGSLKYREIKLWGIIPSKVYMDSLDFDPVKIREAIAGGRKAAESPLDEAALRKIF
jgi:NTE family protein